MVTIVKCVRNDYPALCDIWERSVRATHDLLTEESVQEIKASLIPDYFPAVSLYAALDDGTMTGFIGLSGDRIEMLFVDSGCRSRGYGSLLIDFARSRGASKVDVNEQNPQALEFYLARGFRVISRDDTDGDGRPYPVLHLSL